MQISRCEITSRDRDSDRITDLQLATGKPSTPVAFPARDGAVEEAAPSRNRFAKRMSTKWTDSAVREVLRARCGICDGHHVGEWEGGRDAAREKRGLSVVR